MQIIDETIAETIRMMLARDEMENAFEELFGKVKRTSWADEVIILSGRFHELKSGLRTGIVSFEKATLEKNQIRNSLLDLLEDMQKKQSLEALQELKPALTPPPKTDVRSIYSTKFRVVYRDIPTMLETQLKRFAEEEQFVRGIEIGPYYEWVIMRDRNLFWQYGVSKLMEEKLWEFYHANEHIKQLSLGSNGEFVIIRGSYGYFYSGIPQALITELEKRYAEQQDITQVVLGANDSFVMIYGYNGYQTSGMPQALIDQLWNFNQKNENIKHVALGPRETFAILQGSVGFYISAGVPQDFYDKMFELNKTANEIKQVVLLQNGGWLILYV